MLLRELLAILVTGPSEAEVFLEGTSRNYFPLAAVKSVEFATWRLAEGRELIAVTLRASKAPEVTTPVRVPETT